MARLPVYEVDNTITSGDKLIGTDANGMVTKNFTVGDLKSFIESGINVLLKVPHGYVPTVDQANEDWAVSGIRQDLTQLDTTITFVPSNTDEVDDHVNVNVGQFSLLATGDQWYMEIEEYVGRYYLYSFIGKTILGTWGVSNTVLSFTVDSIAKDGETDWRVDDEGNRIWRFNITRLDPDAWGALTEVQPIYSEVQVRAEDNDDETLQLATVYFQSDVDMQNVHIDELDADKITFAEPSDPFVPKEGIYFGDESIGTYTQLVLDPMTSNLLLETHGEIIFDIDAPVEIDDTLEVDGKVTINAADSLLVQGESVFNDQIEVNDNVFIQGTNNLDFRIADNRVVNIDNFENVIINKDGISKRDHDNNSFDITYVIANNPTSRQDSNDNTVAPANRGSLFNIQIGDDYWTIPQAVSQVAQVLPGFGEGLTGPTDAIITGTFFYGFDRGTYAEWQSTPSTQITGESIPAGDTAKTITQSQRANANTLWNDLDLVAQAGQRLFFIESTDSLPSDISPGDRVELNTYEVVSYVNDTGNMTFSLVGEGVIFVSAPHFELQNLASDSNEETILVLDNDNRVRQKEFSDIAGIAATANYSDTDDSEAFGTLKRIEFESGPHSHNVTTNGTGGVVNVDVTGRLPFDPHDNNGAEYIASFSADAWHSYVLGAITEDQTITLPSSANLKTGATIRIVNVSDLNDVGQQIDVAAFWQVAPASGERIMKLPADEVVVLNEANTHEFIWTGNASIGWAIK